jgi:3-deoxy-D-manno-octulosonic-acid transferase
MTRYDLIYLGMMPAVLPVLAYRRLVRGKYRQSAAGMLGRGEFWRDPGSFKQYPQGSIWLHAVSAGEVVAAKAAAPELKQAFPDLPLVASTTTETGQAAARRLLDEAEETFYYPLDISWNVRKCLRRFRPRAIVLFEAELWPNFLTESAAAGAKIFVVNGRISERSLRRFRKLNRAGWLHRIMTRPLDGVAAFCMQTDEDAERLRQVVGPTDRVFVTGNCKFDTPYDVLDDAERRKWLERLGVDPERPVIVAGNTHEGEEEIILEAFDQVRASRPDTALLLAPRHPERFDQTADLLRRRGLSFRRSTAPEAGGDEPPQVVLLDTMGQLAKAYGLGLAAVVGGSFTPVGGHNLLEAAAHAIPVIYGPHMHRQPDILRLVGGSGGGLQLQPEDLGRTLLDLLGDDDRRRDLGLKAQRALEENRGSARRAVEIVKRFSEMGAT